MKNFQFITILLLYTFANPFSANIAKGETRDEISVVTFNIKWLGHYKKKDNQTLAAFLSKYDVVLIQELVAPPYGGQYPDGTSYRGDKESGKFFDAMKLKGFSFALSEEDTGGRERIHDNSPKTEWFAVFYKPQRIQLADDLPSGFLAGDRSKNPAFGRVPHAFAFRVEPGKSDFVLISVHLESDKKKSAKRKQEIQGIMNWIARNDTTEKDFIIAGDFNFQTCREMKRALPQGMASLNGDCRRTNLAKKARPYDHVFYFPAPSKEIQGNKADVINLIEAMKGYWPSNKLYPWRLGKTKGFDYAYSDHFPLVFKLRPTRDDD